MEKKTNFLFSVFSFRCFCNKCGSNAALEYDSSGYFKFQGNKLLAGNGFVCAKQDFIWRNQVWKTSQASSPAYKPFSI